MWTGARPHRANEKHRSITKRRFHTAIILDVYLTCVASVESDASAHVYRIHDHRILKVKVPMSLELFRLRAAPEGGRDDSNVQKINDNARCMQKEVSNLPAAESL